MMFGAVFLVSCASTGYDPARVQSELRQAGLTNEQARCVTNEMEKEFDPRVLSTYSDPTAPELAKARSLVARCGVNLPRQ
jgi:hypothetical protein